MTFPAYEFLLRLMGVNLFADDLLTPLTHEERQTAECESSNIVLFIF